MSQKRRLPSLSKSALLLSGCLTWTAAGARHYDDRFTDTTKRDRGTYFHRMIAAHITGGIIASAPDQEMANWFKAARDYVDHVLRPRCETIMAEVAIGINWTSGSVEVLVGCEDRDYPEGPEWDGWVFGTADVVAILKDGGLLVADWKTGGTEGAEMQLLSLANGFQVAMTQEFRKTSEHAVQLYRPVRISCLKVFGGGVDADERPVTREELSLHWDAMKMVYQDVQCDPGQPLPGVHCTTLYCPHLAFCEAVGGLVKDAAQGPEGKLSDHWHAGSPYPGGYDMTDRFVSDEHAGWVAERVSAAKRQLDYYTNSLKDYVANGGRVVSGIWEWGPGPGGHRWRRR